MFGTKRSKINQSQKTIEYKTNEQSAKYLNWNMEIESCRMFGNIECKTNEQSTKYLNWNMEIESCQMFENITM